MAETTGSAIVLGGGGVTGIAWEIGVLAGLLDAGVDLGADAVLGTSAGAFVGTALAAGADIEQLDAAQQAPAVDEPTTNASRTLTAAWGRAFLRGRGNPERVGAGFGAVARRFTPQVSVAERRRTVQARLYTNPASPRSSGSAAAPGSTAAWSPRPTHDSPTTSRGSWSSPPCPRATPESPRLSRTWKPCGPPRKSN